MAKINGGRGLLLRVCVWESGVAMFWNKKQKTEKAPRA
jgi:hypothetical protein